MEFAGSDEQFVLTRWRQADQILRWRRSYARSAPDASNDARKLARLLPFELEIRCRPFLRQLCALLLYCWRCDFESMRKRYSQKIQYASGGIAVGSDNIFIKENERLNVVFTKIICPARFVSHDSFIPSINYVEIEPECGVRLRFLARV